MGFSYTHMLCQSVVFAFVIVGVKAERIEELATDATCKLLHN